MEAKTFRQRRWPLYYALAWVLTRDLYYCERAEASDFHPYLDKEDQNLADVDKAWDILHQSLVRDEVPAFRRCVDVLADTASEPGIAPGNFASLDWSDLTKDDGDHSPAIVVSATAMVYFFPPDGPVVAFTSDHIGPPIRPGGPGFMTLSNAAYWIATEGGTKLILARDISVWKDAFAELFRRIQSGDVRIVGRRHGASLSERIDAASFVDVVVDYPYVDTPIPIMFGGAPYIKCYGVADQHHSDELYGSDRHVPEWTHLRAQCSDINSWWPFSEVPRTKRGRKPGWDWGDIELFVRNLLDERGDFDHELNRTQDWKSLNSLIAMVQKYIEDRGEKAPSESILKERLPPVVDGWRKQNPRHETDKN